ncbi:hypothetical protein AB0395_03465 [Streptosporangium sp. NPDC051023]|uniref:hypothetical protein n=1 Tax=Streptosporangium sp. NPDC051023 TaxID=3155410 RepID=UPI0034505AF7
MRRVRRAAAAVLLGVLAFAVPVVPAVPVWAEPGSSGTISVEAFVRRGDRNAQVVTTVRNVTGAPIDRLRVELWNDGKVVVAADRVALPAKQSTVVRLTIDDPENSHVVVTARAGGIEDQVAVPPKGAKAGDPEAGAMVVALVTSLLSLLGVGLGVFVTHVTNDKREKHRMRFEARKNDTDRYSPAYREFLDRWNSSISSSHLESRFGQLRGKAYVPENVVTLYGETLVTLRDAMATTDAKKAAARRLYTAVDELTGTRAETG